VSSTRPKVTWCRCGGKLTAKNVCGTGGNTALHKRGLAAEQVIHRLVARQRNMVASRGGDP
jgi:hypothetical protein